MDMSWANSRKQWRTEESGLLQFMGLQSRTQLSEWTIRKMTRGSKMLVHRVYINIHMYQFSHSVKSYSLQPHGLQHARLLSLSSTPRACSNSCSSSLWCHPTILSSVVPFSSRLQSFPASGSFPVNWLSASGGQRNGASALSMNIQGWLPLGLTSLISLLSKGLSRVLSSTTVWKHQFFGAQLS